MGRWMGIDLGTTYSAIACVNTLGKPEIVINRDGTATTPSVVLFADDAPLVGAMAKRAAVTAPLDVAAFVKREMGRTDWRFETEDGRKFRAEEISALILKRLKEDAEDFTGEPVTDVVITVPAYFDDKRRRATADAGAIAGLKVHRVLNEPTAAALAYGLLQAAAGTVLVYDLGGGTFDVTVLRISGGDFDVVSTVGDRNLGGFHWDSELMTLINERFVASGGPDLIAGGGPETELREKAEIAKHTLSTVEQTKVVVSAGGVTRALTITRADFEQVTASLLNRTRDLATIAVEDAHIRWAEVDTLLLVGGSTRMPMVRTMMEALAGRKAARGINPDELVALGAAVQAEMLRAEVGDGGSAPLEIGGRPITVQDVTSHGLGALSWDPETRVSSNVVIIGRNAKIPAIGRQYFQTVSDGQTRVEVKITLGDDVDPQWCEPVETVMVDFPPYPAGAPIEIRYGYDANQMIYVQAVDQTTGVVVLEHTTRRVDNMTSAQITDAALRMREIEVS